MSEQTYTPRAGSKAEAAIMALQARKWLSRADLAAEIDVDVNSVDGNVQSAINHGLIRRVARDGRAGFALGQTGEPPARDVEDEEGTKIRVQARKLKKTAPAPKPTAKPKRAAPVKRQAPADPPLNNHPVSHGHAVGILECGTVVIVDSLGYAVSLSPGIARRVAELVARTA